MNKIIKSYRITPDQDKKVKGVAKKKKVSESEVIRFLIDNS